MTDAELISRVLIYDDHKAFEKLVLRYQNDVRNLLLKLTLFEESTVDDLTQEVFIRVYKYLKSYRASARFSTWLYKIAYRVFLEEKKKSQSRIQGTSMPGPDATIDVEKQMNAQLDAVRLLSMLKEEERLCIELAYLKGFSHADVAEILNCPLGTVKSHIRRGKLKLLEYAKAGDTYGA